jgi:hypothetical protein
MQQGLTKDWKPKSHHAGVFHGYNVMGSQFQTPLGEIGWHTTLWTDNGADPVHDFWVADGVFNSASFHFFYDGRNTLIEIFGPISDVDAGERGAVLTAISEWKKSKAA